MNVQQLQVTAYRHIAGTVQVPLVMLVWGALVLFFGYQYQANALLPSNNNVAAAVSLEADELLRAQERNDRLLAALAAQTPVPVPSLLDRQVFAAQLAAELAGYELDKEPKPAASEAMSPAKTQLQAVRVKVASNVVVDQVAVEPVTALVDVAGVEAKTKSKVKAQPVEVRSRVEVQRKIKTKAKNNNHAAANTNTKAAKFVRLPAVVQRTAAMRVDTLRASKDKARAELLAGRSNVAYKRLRGKVAQGRTDIEFLGLLALASLPQQPGEAEVIYQHLTQLQPDAQRWRQGLVQSQRLLAERQVDAGRAGGSALSAVGGDRQLGRAG